MTCASHLTPHFLTRQIYKKNIEWLLTNNSMQLNNTHLT